MEDYSTSPVSGPRPKYVSPLFANEILVWYFDITTRYRPRKIIMSDNLVLDGEVREGFILLGKKGVYKVEKFLGEGSFGRVAKCKKLGTDKVVAIKIVSGSAQTEINLLKELSKIDGDKHNLVKMVDCFRYKSYTCIAMELLDQSLYDFMRERYNQPLTVEEIKTIAWQMIVALKGLESINLVHCDIKLDNIMLVDQVSEPFRVKLIDFGVSDKITNMRTGCLMQNMVYRAPEVHLGLPLDQRVDMWSLGYVLCVLYTGTFIHGWDSEYDIIRAMVNIFFTKTEENSGKKLWKLDTPLQQSLKTEKLREVEQFVDLLKRMLMMDPSKRISPSEALRHPFFTLGRMQPTAGSNNTKPAAVEGSAVPLQRAECLHMEQLWFYCAAADPHKHSEQHDSICIGCSCSSPAAAGAENLQV
uniref:Protein kinase domain-containing protein n=1 Tax=Oryzias melastigma TaxID=30732 RepID=A0A3B3CXX8_ORYME